jgi:hypothetical protein
VVSTGALAAACGGTSSSWNSALQYGHFAQPVASMGRYTFGCEHHSTIWGIGQDNGRSARLTR